MDAVARTARMGVALMMVVLGAACAAASAPTSAPTHLPIVWSMSSDGPRVSDGFATGADWAVHFSFACARASRFRVTDRSTGATVVDWSGVSRTGTQYVHGEPGKRVLRIDTACRWSVTVVDGETLPRADAASNQGG